MKYQLKALIADEISLKATHANISPEQRVQIKSQFTCNLRRNFNGNPDLNCVALTFLSASTEKEPAPFDIKVTFVGIFEGAIADKDEEKIFATEGTKIIYPYLRTAVCGLTTSANGPLLLPIVCPINFDRATMQVQQSNENEQQKNQYVFKVDENLN